MFQLIKQEFFNVILPMLKDVKKLFYTNITKIPIVERKYRYLLLVWIISYLLITFALTKWMKGININPTYIDMVYNVLGVGLDIGFVFCFKKYLLKTLDFSFKQIKNAFVFSGAVYYVELLMRFIYLSIASALIVDFNRDVQHLSEVQKINWMDYLSLVISFPIDLMMEEFFCFAVFLFFLSFFKKANVKNVFGGILCTSLCFGLLHFPNYGWETVPFIAFCRIAISTLFILSLDLKAFYIYHIFVDLIAFAHLVDGDVKSTTEIISMLFIFPSVMWICSRLLDKSLNCEKLQEENSYS